MAATIIDIIIVAFTTRMVVSVHGSAMSVPSQYVRLKAAADKSVPLLSDDANDAAADKGGGSGGGGSARMLLLLPVIEAGTMGPSKLKID